MATQITQDKIGGGNTKSPPTISVRSRKWIIVINNYTEKKLLKLLSFFKSDSKYYILAKEIGESKTPHIQAYCNLKTQRTFNAMKKDFPTAHLEVAKGTDKQNFMYCSKDGDFQTNMKFKIPKKIIDPLEGKELYNYQTEIIEIINNGDNDRAINWYYEPIGNTGKSSLCKHLCMNYNCMILNGKQSDMFNAILQFNESTGDFPEVIIIDIPRSMSGFVSYGGIEKIKDGCFYSGKYEGGMCVFNCPTVICFSNSEPDKFKMSQDRWNICEIAIDNVIDIGVEMTISVPDVSSSEESGSSI